MPLFPVPKIVYGKRAYLIAEICRPEILAEIGRQNKPRDPNVFDYLSSINVGPWFFEPNPSVYFFVLEDDTYYFVGYCFYHYRDVASPKEPDFYPFRHRHDFEGMVSCFYKTAVEMVKEPFTARPIWTATRSHFTFQWAPEGAGSVRIEPYGHGVHPIRLGTTLSHESNWHLYRHYRLVDLHNTAFKDIHERLRALFAQEGVSLPDEWEDSRLDVPKGAFYRHPGSLYEAAKEYGFDRLT